MNWPMLVSVVVWSGPSRRVRRAEVEQLTSVPSPARTLAEWRVQREYAIRTADDAGSSVGSRGPGRDSTPLPPAAGHVVLSVVVDPQPVEVQPFR